MDDKKSDLRSPALGALAPEAGFFYLWPLPARREAARVPTALPLASGVFLSHAVADSLHASALWRPDSTAFLG